IRRHRKCPPLDQREGPTRAMTKTAKTTEDLGKGGANLSQICCVRPPVEHFTFVDENANLGTVMRYEIELRILLLCGSDLLESFCIPGLWN
ncbi:Nicotinamide/nicotinic acid mononucleotide adenylyltransferase 2, partial [Camelus dromedarius]